MTEKFFIGKLVTLHPMDIEKDTESWEKWDCDFEYQRQLNLSPAVQFSASMAKELFDEPSNSAALFMIRTLEAGHTIGFIELDGFDWTTRQAWVGIGIGDPEYRGKGFGTDAMRVILDYAFRGLNLHRVNLNVFEYNTRAIRSYEKCGFKYEGTEKELIFKDNQRWNAIDMGILRSDWDIHTTEM